MKGRSLLGLFKLQYCTTHIGRLPKRLNYCFSVPARTTNQSIHVYVATPVCIVLGLCLWRIIRDDHVLISVPMQVKLRMEFGTGVGPVMLVALLLITLASGARAKEMEK